MQRIDRPEEAPGVLRASVAKESRARLQSFWALARLQRDQTNPPVSELSSSDPRLVLSLAKFSRGRCAFCEVEEDLVAYRFRPPSNALPLREGGRGHLYYTWLADAWQNLYPICQSCIPPEPQFPVLDDRRAQLPAQAQVDNYVESGEGLWPSYPPKETPLLLDPALDRGFEKHIIPKLDGELIGVSLKGETTIDVFNLNRPERRNQRLQTHSARFDILLKGTTDLSVRDLYWPELFDFDNLEFGGSWYLLLRRIARAVGGPGTRASRAFVRSFYQALVADNGAQNLLTKAVQVLGSQDINLRGGRWRTGSVYSLRSPIRSVQIRNFKAIERLMLELEPPEARSHSVTPSMVILGENATGKSSILEAIALSLATPQARTSLKPPWSRMALDPSQLGSLERPGPRRAEVKVALANGQSVTLKFEGATPTVESEFGNHQVAIFAYGAFRRFLTRAHRWTPHRHIRNLFDGSTLSNPETWLRKLPPDRFNEVVRTLRNLLSIDGSFDVIERDGAGRRLRMVTSITEPDGTVRLSKAPLQTASSGYRSMLGMLCDIMQGLMNSQVYEGFESFQTARGVVLIDEIEAHLHPKWKMQVMTSLRTALPGMTFIVTTHDPLCLRGMEDGEVVVLQRVATAEGSFESSLPIVVERMTDLPLMSNLRVEQLLTSDFFQLMSSDDPSADREMARVADLIAKRDRGEDLGEADEAVLCEFERDIASALPVGSSEAHRMVQDAVAEYLRLRRDASSDKLKKLRVDTRKEILDALDRL